jgi:hypothetical protein
VVLVSWKTITIPKSQGGRGLKNIFLFSKVLAAKIVWRLVQGFRLCAHVIKDKYIAPNSMEDYVRKPVKISQNASIIWKIIISTFPLIGKWMV